MQIKKKKSSGTYQILSKAIIIVMIILFLIKHEVKLQDRKISEEEKREIFQVYI